MACESTYNCSSRGSCKEGVCVCSVEFAGDQCSDANTGFTAAFSSLFSLLFLISFIQLVMCIHAEYRKLKYASILAACRITTQKLLHLLTLVAALSRVLYFALMGLIPDIWLQTMERVYDPLLITGMSLVVCYWSEAFFLEDVSAYASKGGCFLSKSWLAFTLFNMFLYLAVVVQFIIVYSSASGSVHIGSWFVGAFQSFFAIVLFIIYVIFMTIGVEMYFKVRGAFKATNDGQLPSTSNAAEVINSSEVLKSRLAIIVQALFLLLMVLCAVSEAVATLWKDKVDVRTRSIHVVMHRMAEVGVVLWFPCVLWNSAYPEQLWFLNPRKLLCRNPVLQSLISRKYSGYSTFTITEDDLDKRVEEKSECWICFDDTSTDEFISPCLCKGGMAKVHHNCLKRWLLENYHDGQPPSCNVCKHQYDMQREYPGPLPCLPCTKWTMALIAALVICAVAPCALIYMFKTQNELKTPLKVTITGFSILFILICLRVFAVSLSNLLRITRESSMRIFNYNTPASQYSESSDDEKEVSTSLYISHSDVSSIALS